MEDYEKYGAEAVKQASAWAKKNPDLIAKITPFALAGIMCLWLPVIYQLWVWSPWIMTVYILWKETRPLWTKTN